MPGRKILFFLLCLILTYNSYSQNSKTDLLLQNFQDPGNAARPRVWWHWMNGNITKEGIQKDLEWMHRAGIGGFQNFDASLMTPQIVKERLTYMTPGLERCLSICNKTRRFAGFGNSNCGFTRLE